MAVTYRTAMSAGRERKSSDVQYYIKRHQTGTYTGFNSELGDDNGKVIQVDATSKQPPEATDPTTYTIPTDDKDKEYAETVTGRPTLGTGTAEVVLDGGLLDLFKKWRTVPEGEGASEIVVSVAMLSKSGMLRIYPRVEILSVTAGSVSSDNTYMTATLNFQRQDRDRHDGEYTVYPPAMVSADMSGMLKTTAPLWARGQGTSLGTVADASWDSGKAYAALKTLYTEDT